MADIFDLADTWNNGGTVFTAIKMNVTDTASDSTSRLMDLQVGGTSVFSVKKDGTISINTTGGANFFSTASFNDGGIILGWQNSGGFSPCNKTGTSVYGRWDNGGVLLPASLQVGWTASTPNAAYDTSFARNAAGVVEINNGTPGTFRDLYARNVRTQSVSVASLVAAATAGEGARAFVNDSSVTTFGSTVSGGGSNKVPVYSDGTNWKVG